MLGIQWEQSLTGNSVYEKPLQKNFWFHVKFQATKRWMNACSWAPTFSVHDLCFTWMLWYDRWHFQHEELVRLCSNKHSWRGPAFLPSVVTVLLQLYREGWLQQVFRKRVTSAWSEADLLLLSLRLLSAVRSNPHILHADFSSFRFIYRTK